MAEQQQNHDNSRVEVPSRRSITPSTSTVSSAGKALGKKPKFPNPPDPFNPDPTTLRDQWRYAIRQYSRWYSQAWGTAILAGLSFFALGWFIKGSNPLPSRAREDEDHRDSSLPAVADR